MGIKPLRNGLGNTGEVMFMKFKIPLFLGILILLSHVEAVMAGKFIVVEDEYHWYSPNLAEIPVGQMRDIHVKRGCPERSPMALGDMAYNKHFDSQGTPPPLNFLRPLERGGSSHAEIKGRYVVFKKTGNKIALNTSSLPPEGCPADPYLLTIPNSDRVFIVYPYYLFQNKENEYYVEMYSSNGQRLATFNNLPTHFLASNPNLLISPERSGCCDSLSWNIRFYNLHEGLISEYKCPEGFCGDVLFTKLGEKGPFVIVQEILGSTAKIGSSLQTNIYIINEDGSLSASAKIIHAIRDTKIDGQMMELSSPYAASNLVSVDPLPDKDSWLIVFGVDTKKKTFKLVSRYEEPTPSVLILIPKDDFRHSRNRVRLAEEALGNLPLIGIINPGEYTISVYSDDGSKEEVKTEVKPDQVNIVMF